MTDETIKIIISSGIVSTIFSSIIGATFSVWLKFRNDKRMAEIQRQHEESKTLLCHNLEIAKLEHQIRFAGTSQKIVETIEELYPQLLGLYEDFINYFSTTEDAGEIRQKNLDAFQTSLSDFRKLFVQKKIFLSLELEELIEKFLHGIRCDELCLTNTANVEVDGKRIFMDFWVKVSDNIQKDWSLLAKAIAKEFRHTLGIISVDKNQAEPNTHMKENKDD